MKLSLPELPPDLPVELRNWMQDVTNLLNLGVYAPRIFTTAPTISQMEIGEIAGGSATGAGSANEIFWKVSSTEIARFTEDGTIT